MKPTKERNGDLCEIAMNCCSKGSSSLSNFPGLMKEIIETRAWECREWRGKVFELSSLKDLVTRKPLEGWGEDPAAIEALLKSDPEALQMWRQETKQKQGQRNDIHDNIRDVRQPDYGTSKAHTLDVLKRKAPEKFRAVCNGELSANAAMIAAGLRKPTVTVTSDPAAAVKTLRKKFGDDYIKEMIKIIQSIP